jgi:hypothetical protein
VIELLDRQRGAARSLFGELLHLRAPRSHEGELDRDEEPVQQHEQEQQEKEERGQFSALGAHRPARVGEQ